MTIHTEKSPLTVGAVNEDNMSIEERSIQTAYIARPSLNTRFTLGTYSGKHLPRKDYISLVVDMDHVAHMMNGNTVLFQIDASDVAAHDVEVKQQREKQEAEQREMLKRQITTAVYEKYDEEFKRLDAEADKIYSDLSNKVAAEIKRTLEYVEGNR